MILLQGRWGLTAAEEEREEWRQEDFRTEFLPVQRAQLQIVSRSYEVSAIHCVDKRACCCVSHMHIRIIKTLNKLHLNAVL